MELFDLKEWTRQCKLNSETPEIIKTSKMHHKPWSNNVAVM